MLSGEGKENNVKVRRRGWVKNIWSSGEGLSRNGKAHSKEEKAGGEVIKGDRFQPPP